MADDEEDDVFQYSDSEDDESSDTESVCSSTSSVASDLANPSDDLSSQKKHRRRERGGKRKKAASILVGNLLPGCRPNDLVEHFKAYKPHIVNKPKIMAPKKSTDAQYRFTFVYFSSLDKAKEAVAKMNGTYFQKKKLNVKLQEKKKKPADESNSKTRDMRHDTKRPSQHSPTVKVQNLPKGIDEDDLKGLVAQYRVISCKVFGQSATLRFSSPEDAGKAVGALNEIILQGAHLRAELVGSKAGQDPSHHHGEPIRRNDRKPAKPHRSSSVQDVPSGSSMFMPPTSPSTPYPRQTGGMYSPPVAPPHATFTPGVRMPYPPHPGGVPFNPPPPHPGVPFNPPPPPYVQRSHSVPHHPLLPLPPPLIGGYGQPMQQPTVVLDNPNDRRKGRKSSTREESKSHVKPPPSDSGRRAKESERKISLDLYDMFCKSSLAQIQSFKDKGGSLEYECPSLKIKAPAAKEAQVMLDLLDTYSEKKLDCSPNQWNKLVVVNERGQREMDELTAPFKFNPAVRITEEPMKLVFVGIKDAVDAAYYHIRKHLKKEIRVESSQLSALVQLEPDLSQKIEAEYGLSIKGYTVDSSSISFDGASENSETVQSLLSDKLENICSVSLPVRPHPLLQAGKKDCLNKQVPVIVSERENELLLVSSSDSHLQEAKAIFTRQPYVNVLELSRFDEACLKVPFPEMFSFKCVNVRDDEAKVVLEGFFKEDVQAAKKIVLNYLYENYKRTEPKNERNVSLDLYDMFCKSCSAQIQGFKDKGGSLEYECPNLKIKAPAAKEAQIMLDLLDTYSEKKLVCSPDQWNRLVVVNERGQREMDNLIAPFKFNPAVRIIEKPMNLVFIGSKDAVDAAYCHICKHLKCETSVESLKLCYLIQLEPDLPQKIQADYGLSIKGYTVDSASISFDDASDNSETVQSLLSDKLENICSVSLPVRPHPLLQAGKKDCLNKQVPVIVSERENELLLVSSSDSHLQEAKAIFTRQPYVNVLELSRFDEACLKVSFSKVFSFEYVNVRDEETKIVLEGFFKEDVQSAKKVVSKYLQENYKKTKQICSEALVCSEEQRVYLCHLLNKDEPAEEVKNLPATALVQEGNVVISGTEIERAKTSHQLLELVPEFQLHVFEVKNTRFIKPLIEQHVLKMVDHVILEEKGKEKHRKLRVFVYENKPLALASVGKSLADLDPGVRFFYISPKAKSLIKNLISTLEKQHRCRVDLMKLESPSLAVHGLTQEERDQVKTAIQEYIEENYIIVRELPSPPVSRVQMKYILLKHGEELKEQGELLRSCDLPFFLVKKPALEVSSETSICFKVVGSAKAITLFDDSLKDFTEGSFFEERFPLTLSNLNRYPWRKRWEALRKEAEDSQTAVVEYKLPSRDSSSPISFIIYGDQADNVLQLKETIESEASAGVAKSKMLKLTPEQFKEVQEAYRNKKLNFDDYLVEVKFVEKDNIIYINSLAVTADTIQVVESEITGFINCTSTTSEDILFPDLPLHFVFTDSKKFPFYRKALLIAKNGKVSLSAFKHGTRMGVCLKGSTASVNAVKDQISLLVKEAKSLMGTVDVAINPLFQPALTQNVKKTLENKLLINFFVTMHNTPKRSRETRVIECMYIQPSPEALRVKLSLCQGILASQSTDAIVNPTNENLQLVGGLGLSIQQDSTQYVQKHGKLNPGEAVSLSSSGTLPCKQVVHVVSPRWQGEDDEEGKVMLHCAILNSLQAVEALTSICLPAIGFGKFNFPADVCADMSLRAVRDFCMLNPQSSLKEVSFILTTKETQKSFTEMLPKVFPPEALSQPSEQLKLLPSSSPSNITWLWKNDHGGYSHYGFEESQQLATLFNQNPQGTCSLTVKSVQYTIDLARMVQVNVQTQYERKIMKMSGEPGSWFWIDDNGIPSLYSPADSAAIENMYKSNLLQTIIINGRSYHFNFHRMLQINSTTNHECPIQRIPELISPSSPSTSEDGQAMSITLYGVKSNLDSARKLIESQLETSVKVEEIGPLVLGQSLERKVKEVASKYKISYEIKSTVTQGKQVLVIMKGVKVDSAAKDLYRYIYEQQTTDEDTTPPEWEPQSTTTQLFPVRRGSPEWMKVEQQFNRTMSSHHIQEIQRIQNTYLWEKWIEERNRIEKFKGCINEKELFHGTRGNDPKLIYDSEIGFDMRFCSSGMWGQANYFAVNASYSHAYCHTNASNQREMFLVRVITGNSCHCDRDSSLRMPPLKDSGLLKLSQVRYDTVTGITNGSQVFMTYDNQKAYPAYLIRY